MALVSAVLFGLAPAIRATRGDLTAVMKASDAAGIGRRRRWGRAVLVCGQVAISVVLLVVATFVYRGFQQQLGGGPGFRTDPLLMMSLAPSQLRYSDAQATRFFERLAEQARLVAGVESAALTRFMPMDGVPPSVAMIPEGFQFPPGKETATVATSIVDEYYFDTFGLPILRGRAFRATDSSTAPKVAVVNEVVAQRYWPAQDRWASGFVRPRRQLGRNRRRRENGKYSFVLDGRSVVSPPTGSARIDVPAGSIARRSGQPRRTAQSWSEADTNLPIANLAWKLYRQQRRHLQCDRARSLRWG